MVKQKKNESFCLSMFSPQPNKTKPTTSSLKFHFFFLISVFPTTKQNLAKQQKNAALAPKSKNKTEQRFLSLSLFVLSPQPNKT